MTTIIVHIPSLLRSFVNGHDKVLAPATGDVHHLINYVELSYPGFKARVCDEAGKTRKGINIFVNGEDIRFLDGMATLTNHGDEVELLPAIAGGSNITAYPLCWPAGWPREKSRISANQFKGNTLWKANGSLRLELQRLGAADIILSTNVPLRIDGQPRSDWERSMISDPGVAVYFMLTRSGRDQQMVMARDLYRDPASNLRSLGLAVEHLRGLERHGGGTMLERAFTGFTALPAPGDSTQRTWRQVMDVTDPTHAELRTRYVEMAKRAHPDAGGSTAAQAELNQAYDQAKKELNL